MKVEHATTIFVDDEAESPYCITIDHTGPSVIECYFILAKLRYKWPWLHWRIWKLGWAARKARKYREGRPLYEDVT